MKKLLTVLLLSSAVLAACGDDSGDKPAQSNGPSKFAQTVGTKQIEEGDKIENKTALAKEFVAVYMDLLTNRELLEDGALDTYIDEHFDSENKAELKEKALSYLNGEELETSTTIISVAQTEKDVLKLTVKLTFKGTENKSTNATIFGRVSEDGNKIIEIKGH